MMGPMSEHAPPEEVARLTALGEARLLGVAERPVRGAPRV